MKLLGDATYGRVLLNTFTVAGVVTLVTLLIGYPVAWLLARRQAAKTFFGGGYREEKQE